MSAPDHDARPTTVAEVQRMFATFAGTLPDARLYRALALGIAADDDVARLLLAARPGQARPILLLAALHDLVLEHPELPAARWYPTVTGAPVPPGDPWPDARAAALAHADRLTTVVASRATQTNEANRAVHVGALVAAAAADVTATDVVLLEMGASAGLLLELDRYRIEVGAPGAPGAVVLGDASSPVVVSGELREGSARGLALPRVVGRVGLDLQPVALDDARELRWLEACLWPDQPERVERFRAAVAALRASPPTLVRGDMVADLERVAEEALAADTTSGRAHLVVLSSWALTYVDPHRRDEVAQTLGRLAASGRPVSWLSAEPPGCVPGLPAIDPAQWAPGAATAETVLGARLWRDRTERPPAVWGLSHPHGAWLHWRGR